MTFALKLDAIITKHNSLLCVGLDSNIEKLPQEFKTQEHPQFAFNKYIIDQTHDLVCAYKPNSAFYEACGANGVAELKMTCDYIRENHPEIAIVLDAKRGDIGNTNEGYVKFAFSYLGADAITLHPYLGKEALQPFLDQTEKGCIILCKTSNPGSGEFQNIRCHSREGGNLEIPDRVGDDKRESGDVTKLYHTVASNIAKNWNTNGNCMLVVGATYPKELAEIRAIAGDMTFLVPGIGAQGGDLKATLVAGLNSAKKGIIINAGRSIIFSENPKEEAEKLRDEINEFRS
jgi:orotidine-5'-phosphate decarboxylase